MATSDVRKSILEIINVVQIRLGLNATAAVDSTKQSTMLLELLNDVIEETSNFGDWPQMFREVLVTAQSSVGSYEVAASANVKNVVEIAWGTDPGPLEVRTIEDLRRLQRISSYGTPRQFAIVGVSGVNPLFRTYPVPTTAKTFDVWFYKKPRTYTTSDGAVVPSFPAKVLEKGLYAKALLEEAGGEPTKQSDMAYQEFFSVVKEEHNRFTSDTGTDLYLSPTGARFA